MNYEYPLLHHEQHPLLPEPIYLERKAVFDNAILLKYFSGINFDCAQGNPDIELSPEEEQAVVAAKGDGR